MHVLELNMSFIPKHEPDNSAMMAIAGENFVIIGVDTAIATPPAPHKQRQNRIFKLTEHCTFASTGCTCYTLPYVQAARNCLEDVLTDYTDHVLRNEKTLDIISSMTTGRGRRFPYIHNVLATFNGNVGCITAFSATECVERNTNFFTTGFAAAYAPKKCDSLRSSDVNHAIDFVTNCFTRAAKEVPSCKDTLHLAVITTNGISMIEKTLK